MQRVFVVSHSRKQLMPCSPARARMLLRGGKAAVLRRFPFTIILRDRIEGSTQPVELKVDPGSRVTGIALVAEFKKRGREALFAVELQHRGVKIRRDLETRRAARRSRRNRKTRYRAARFGNRLRPEGWLPPSLMSRVYNVKTWAMRLQRFAPLKAITVETVRFDMQKLLNPEISGVEYQQGALQGYEVREYLLEKWGRKCAYCGAENQPLEIEHIIPRSRGGNNRVSNLTLACNACNIKKGNLIAAEFGYPGIQAQAQKPLKDAAAVNATRYAIGNELKAIGLPITFWSGGRTKFNRIQQGYPKAHWIDAACVGESGRSVVLKSNMQIFSITACGHGSRQTCLMDKYGFPRTSAKAGGAVKGFRTGDTVRAVVPKGKHKGIYIGKVAVRASGSFNIATQCGVIQGIGYTHCSVIHAKDGYSYQQLKTGAPLGNELPSIRAQEVS